MCETIKFEQSVGGFLWNPTTAVLTEYEQILDTPNFTTQSDTGQFHRGVFVDGGLMVRRATLSLTMNETDMETLMAFRTNVRSDYFQMFLGRIDPFLDGNLDTTQNVRFLSLSKPTRNRVNQYSIQIGIVK
tara:strand:+ start:1938 stop:2330 length:393 start_codon:yes stop_codon:yes gene_type:complete